MHKSFWLQDSAIPTFEQSGALRDTSADVQAVGSGGIYGGGKCPGRAESPWAKQENIQAGDKPRAQCPS